MGVAWRSKYGPGRKRTGSAASVLTNDSVLSEDLVEEDEEAEEEWKVEVQARFIRALHELDYMGFIKHTGRKVDHVARTVYDIPD